MKKGICFAILAAVLYAISSPLGKIMLDYLPPTLMAGFLYVGAWLCFQDKPLFKRNPPAPEN